eukprot:TRINITY_DN2906_c0_g1_i2.p3 TRINITY_DN2906_c0_g1~~TRINITY_DN2906_c0_g1_i2.p3  ORF type:complete len:107 (-),score=10.07 TRINITY_DN2906_c0_g1_i2:47-367(-)
MVGLSPHLCDLAGVCRMVRFGIYKKFTFVSIFQRYPPFFGSSYWYDLCLGFLYLFVYLLFVSPVPLRERARPDEVFCCCCFLFWQAQTYGISHIPHIAIWGIVFFK